MWAYHSTFYQIYPIGFCGAPLSNDGIVTPRIRKVLDWTDYLQSLGIDAILFNPVFESDTHGYDTKDFTKLDCRLGANADFSEVCQSMHMALRLCWTVSSIMSEEISGLLKMSENTNGIPLTKTGSISVLTATAATMMDSGTRAGKDILNWSN